MEFDEEEFYKFILNNNVVRFLEEPKTLSSGRKSHVYFDWRSIGEDAYLLDKLTDYIIAFTKSQGLEPDCFYGVPEGATKLGIITQYKWAKSSPNYGPGSHVLAMGRGKPKEHGMEKDRYFLGQPRGKTIIIEDVVTTGDSLLKTIDTLQKVGVEIIACFALTDRMELRDDGKSVDEVVKSKGIQYYALSNALELLPEAYKRLKPEEEIAKAIEEEFKEYGVKRLRLSE